MTSNMVPRIHLCLFYNTVFHVKLFLVGDALRILYFVAIAFLLPTGKNRQKYYQSTFSPKVANSLRLRINLLNTTVANLFCVGCTTLTLNDDIKCSVG